MPIVTLITDYGTHDYYVGAVKGVILRLAPAVRIVDITHDLEPHNILHGAFVLRQTWPWYPAGTIHVAVVDPGVGTDRRILLGKYAGQYVVAPDNGLVTLVHADMPVEVLHAVENHRFFMPEPSPTFHGRDIMAPVAAYLAKGVEPAEFGPAMDDPVLLPIECEAESTGSSLHGQGLYVDRFGTLVTNIRHAQITALVIQGRSAEILVNGTNIGPIRSTFGDVAPGEPLALFGGADLLEIAVNQGRAVDRFGPAAAVRVDVQ